MAKRRMKLKKKRESKETQFERDLKAVASLFHCAYIKIPDTNMINKYNRKTHWEKKRPFDGILITPRRNYCIECKIDYNRLAKHQKVNQQIINDINASFFVLRKVYLKHGVEYRIVYRGRTVHKTPHIENMVKYFK